MERRLAAILAADIAGYSTLMGADEEGTLATVKALRRELIDPAVGGHRGRIVKTTGDGLLIAFDSVIDAVRCAVKIQQDMRERNEGKSNRILFRMGINIGDIIVDGDDIHGDGVNIAARLEGIAEPGGICISRQAYDQVDGKLALNVRSLGPQNLKNIAKPVNVFAVESIGTANLPSLDAAKQQQQIQFCRTPDGVRLAWAKFGQGPPLVRAATWLSHLEYDWENPLRRGGLQRLTKNYTVIRYDARGNGLSDWDVPEVSLDTWVSDLETVVEAAGIDRFPLLGVSQGCAISIAYAVRHPERVMKLVLYGGFVVGANKRGPEDHEQRKAMATLMRLGWGLDDPGFRQLFTSRMIPEATKEQADAYNELQRRTTSPECAARYFETVGNIDVSDLIGRVDVPTLVMHARGDLMCPFEEGRRLAAGIPGARFVALQGNNHTFLPGEPAGARFAEELDLFLAEPKATS